MKEIKQLKSHDFAEVYKWLGINLNKLGCVMLDLDPIEVPRDMIDGFTHYPKFQDKLYFAKDKERFWIDGWVVDKVPHITLLYGLLDEAKNYEPHIEQVLRGWRLSEVEIEDVDYFNSPYEDEKYYCIVAHIKVTDELLEGHRRLEFLPHINTFAGYKPHMTIAYIKKDEEFRDDFISNLKIELVGKKLKVKEEINLGGNK